MAVLGGQAVLDERGTPVHGRGRAIQTGGFAICGGLVPWKIYLEFGIATTAKIRPGDRIEAAFNCVLETIISSFFSLLLAMNLSEVRFAGFGFRVSGFGFRVSGFGFRVSGFGFRVSGFGFRG
jgi:hypothetical protein